MSKALFTFIKDLSEDKSAVRKYGQNMMNLLLEDAASAVGPRAEKLTLPDQDSGWFRIVGGRVEIDAGSSFGTAQSYHKQRIINNPCCVRKVGGEYWVGSYSVPIARFDSDWSFLGNWGRWGDFNVDVDRYAYLRSFWADETNDRLYIVSAVRHMVRAFRLSDGEYLFDIGLYNDPGDPQDGRLYNPRAVATTGDAGGDILIACYNGQPTGAASNNGFAASYSFTDGALKKVLLFDEAGGLPENNEIRNPTGLKIGPDGLAYISVVNNRVAAFSIGGDPDDVSVLSFQTSYHALSPTALDISSSSLFVGSAFVDWAQNRPVSRLDLATHNIQSAFGSKKWEDYPGNPETLGAFQSVDDILLDEDTQSLVAVDYANNRVQQIPLAFLGADEIELDYQTPTSEEGEFVPTTPINGKIKVPLEDVVNDKIPSVIWRIYNNA